MPGAHRAWYRDDLRHGVDDVVVLTRAEAVGRIESLWAEYSSIHFTLPVVVAGDDGEHVAIVYQCEQTTLAGVDQRLGSIEVFHVVDGRIDAVYNNTHQYGTWR
ncbi:MAG: nuclear transport factor 2 family protein [Solirubrobacterales bacterium]